MPEARWEWVVFALGAALTAALLALIVLDGSPKAPRPDSVAAGRPHRLPATTVETTTPALPATVPTTTAAPATTTAPAPPRPASVRLRLTARADTWLSVRRTAAGGRVLYQGTLPAGASRTFSGERFEVRFGAAANVQATLNGKPLPLPGGTYSVTVGRSGLGPRSA